MLQKLLHPSRVARLLACTSILILALGLGGCQTSGLSDITGSIGEKAEHRPRRRSAPRRRALPGTLSRQSEGCRRGAEIRQGAARDGTAVAGGCGARTGHHRPSRQQAAARRLWPRAGGQRQFPAGLRRARPRPQPRRSGLAAALGAGSDAGPTRPIRGGAAILCERAEDRARPAVGAVQSRTVLRAFEGSAEGRGDAAPRPWPCGDRSARARQSGAGGRPAGPSRRGRKDREGRPAARRGCRQRRAVEAHAVAEGQGERAGRGREDADRGRTDGRDRIRSVRQNALVAVRPSTP